ncbi:MAG: acetyl-CoA carboxylase biotin carboxyl carrier protein [Planctomycetota bacterium]|jgi:acetyl-CoA carboxylase biotin carboxyl carrier protein|nr:acetyl-CoA carboxylase biotin carboxyl carrier protein [Planctomycetia bacterium]RLS33005.1 MAG: acetyl-CoA carboxylase biotin carboxyl carrier protein [Planctomycetota bacterium]RLS55500.1 MAG: acetyl-CoA carboxylase biotin carboxyl carrier protein [Planctomycetota bacterium]
MSAKQGPDDIFEIEKIRRLIDLMKEHELSEVDLKQGDQRVRIKRGGEILPTAPFVASSSAQRVSSSVEGIGASLAPSNMKVIASPMVGTFYRSSGPDSAPFVKVGDRIGPETTVCIIEAMKVFNEIPAGVSGQVVAILVENGAPIEFGQVLLKIDPEA